MRTAIFIIDFYEGRWRIDFDGDVFGSFPTRASAQYAAVQMAQTTAELPTRVLVRDSAGKEESVWDPCSLIDDLIENLECHRIGFGMGSKSKFLREDIARRVFESALPELSENEIVDIVLRSFGIERSWLH
jgi:hypothetical protein